MRTRVKYQKHNSPAAGHSNHIVRKWGVTGKASFSPNGNCATITVEEWVHSNPPYPVRLPTHDHEMGHVEFFEDRLFNEPGIKFNDLMDVDVWQCEVDAWLRGLETPFPLEVGMFALDCLWTYAVGCKVSEEDWMEAKTTFAESCLDEEALLDYVPEPVPPGEGATTPGFDMEGEEFPEGDEGDPLPDDGDNYDGLPDGEMPEGEELPGNGGRNEQGGDISERDAWLMTPEALPYLKGGNTEKLSRALKARGYKVEAPLPMVPASIFKKSRGLWPWS